MQKNNFGQGFINAFSNTEQKDLAPLAAPPQLPQKTGVNKKKASNLQQNLINVISQSKLMGPQGE